jgi:hypothetical protein
LPVIPERFVYAPLIIATWLALVTAGITEREPGK